jgi:hypothetical protein
MLGVLGKKWAGLIYPPLFFQEYDRIIARQQTDVSNVSLEKKPPFPQVKRACLPAGRSGILLEEASERFPVRVGTGRSSRNDNCCELVKKRRLSNNEKT